MSLIDEYFLDANPNPERQGCPDEETLKALAEDRLPVSHPARLHLAKCSECYAEYSGYRNEWQEALAAQKTVAIRAKRTRNLVQWAVAASVIVLAGGGLLEYRHTLPAPTDSAQLASSTPVAAEVDLLNAGTVRGAGDDGTTPLQQVSLPAAIVNLTVILPRFSQAGRYEVLASKDKAATQVVAKGSADAQDEAGKVTLKVKLDLRAADAGAYFLATVRNNDNGTYYYPLKIVHGAN